MDFTIDDEQKALQQAARELAARQVSQDAGGERPVGPAPHDSKAWSALCELGALGLPFSQEAGGFGAGPVEVALLAAELGKAGVQSAYADALVAASLLAAGTAGHSLLEAAVAGEVLVLPALAEPGRAWSVSTSSVTAENDGDRWMLTGVKAPVLRANAATHLLVPANTPDGLGVFLVESPDADGPELALGRTPASMLLSSADATDALYRAEGLGIVALAGEALGAMEAALAATTEYLASRKQFGVPLMTFQTLTQRAADMYVSLELARSTVWYGAMQLGDDPEDRATASRIKVIVGQAARHIGQEAIQLHGGIAMTAEYFVGHLTSRLTAIEHTFGDTRTHLASLARTVGDHETVDVLH